jgi:receptor protein-tyrosine kinase
MSPYTSLRDYLGVIRRQWLIVLAIPMVFVIVALAFSSSQPKKYQSEASVKFQDASSDLDPIGAGLIARMVPEERATAGAERVKSPDIQAAVAKKVGGLSGVGLSARPEARSNFVVIRVTARTARRAAVVADAYANATHDIVRRDYRRDLQRQINVRKKDSAKLRHGLDQQGVTAQIELDARLRALKRLGEPVTIVRQATIDNSPVAPKPVRNALLAFVLGLTVALLVAFARASLDRRLRTSRDISESVEMPLLSRVRGETLGKSSIAELSKGNETDALGLEETRILRTNLDFLDVDRDASIVLVTSAVAGEGKSTVAASLAVASALAGRRTLLIECDLRRPVLAERLGLEPTPGLADLVAGQATSAEALREVDLGVAAKMSVNGAGAGAVEAGSLSVLPAGSTAPKPSELLGSRSFTDYLSVLARAYDVTILDTTPLLPVVDTLSLIPLADRLVLCVRARQTTREQLRAARDVIDRLPHPAAGVVVTDVRRGDDLDYGYYSPYAGATTSSE